MKKSVKLALRASEIRSEINKLDPGEDTLEKRRELLANLDTVETEYRAALTEEAEADAAAPDANGLNAEERAFRDLESKAELRMAFRAVMNGAALTGAEKELQEHRGLSGHHLPWDMIAPRPPRRDPHRASRRTRYRRRRPIRTFSSTASSAACSRARRPRPWASVCRWFRPGNRISRS